MVDKISVVDETSVIDKTSVIDETSANRALVDKISVIDEFSVVDKISVVDQISVVDEISGQICRRNFSYRRNFWTQKWRDRRIFSGRRICGLPIICSFRLAFNTTLYASTYF